ncbi:MAG: hypothetical protein HYZ42_05255 [Bacteroidetes bacterium]|nr:hypothetical protein [Bacteroidota bacterium]
MGFCALSGQSQTTLSAGDIAFTAYNSYSSSNNPADTFSFILLRSISSGTTINFTDNGWKSNNVFRTGEGGVTWTASSAMSYGQQVKISLATTGSAASVGSVATMSTSGFNTIPALSTAGDQILAFQGSTSSPNFIAGIHWNHTSTTTASGWDTTGLTTNSSVNPLGSATTGLYMNAGATVSRIITNAIAKSSAYNSDASTFRSNLSDTNNWIRETSNSSLSFTQPPVFNTSGGGGGNVVPYQWAWIGGDTNINQRGVYGVKGTASATNKPGSRYSFASAIDKNKNLWIFGGIQPNPMVE